MNSPGKARLYVIAAVAVVVALVAVIAAVLVVNKVVDDRRAYEVAHVPVAVSVAFDLPGYGDGTGTGVPVRVEGEDLDGNAVSALEVLPATGGSMELLRGEYEVSAGGSPVSAAGTLYAAPSERIALKVEEDGAVVGGFRAAPGVDSSAVKMPFSLVAAQDVTDEQLAGVRAWMQEAGCAAADVDAAVQAATSARQGEIDRIAEEKRKAEEAARRAEELNSARADFTTRFNQLNAAMDSDDRLLGDTRGIIEGAGDYANRYRVLLDEIVGYLDSLPEVDSSALHASQSDWERRSQANLSEVEALYAGGTLLGPNYSLEIVNMCKERIPELIAMIP